MMDIKHFYIEQGDGFPLILLHGNGEDSSNQGLAHTPDCIPNSEIGTANHSRQSFHSEQESRNVQ